MSAVVPAGERSTKHRVTTRTTAKGEKRYDARARVGGRPVTKTFRRRSDADAWLRQVLADDLRGVAVDLRAGKVPLSEYARRWLERGGTRGALAPKTRAYYGDLLRLHIEPTFGSVAVGAVKAEQVREWYSAKRSEAPRIAPKAYRLLATLMRTAVADGLIGASPCRIVGAGKETSAERPLIGPRDAVDLAESIAPELRCAVLLAELCQLRLGELLGLMVEDVDLAGRKVHVRRQALELPKQGRVVTAPKTAAGIRTVAMPDALAAALAHHIDEHCPQAIDGERWLFCAPTGRPWYRWEWQRAWTNAKSVVNTNRAAEGLPGLPPDLHMHDLRHSGLTLVAHTGVTTKELMRRGGHASHSAALRYQHIAEGRDQAIADALGRLFDEPAQPGGRVTPIRTREGRAMGSGSGAGAGRRKGL